MRLSYDHGVYYQNMDVFHEPELTPSTLGNWNGQELRTLINQVLYAHQDNCFFCLLKI